MRPLPEVPRIQPVRAFKEVDDGLQTLLRFLVSLSKEVATQLGQPELNSFTVSALPSATRPGQVIYVSNEVGGSVLAFSDGTNWRRVTDRVIVS